MGKSGGGGPSEQKVTSTNIPEYARPYVESTLGQAAALTDINKNPYQPYGGQRMASFSPMEAQAFQNIAGQQVAPQIADASNMTLGAGQAGMGYGQRATEYGQRAADYGEVAGQTGIGATNTAQQQAAQDRFSTQQFGQAASQVGLEGRQAADRASNQAQEQAFGYGRLGVGTGQQAASMAGLGYGAGSQYARMATDPNQIQSYMSPYMQNVVDVQQQEAMRQADIQRQSNQSQAVSQGAFGGSRQGVVEAEAQRNLATQLGRIQAEGSQRAFEQAQQSQQFGAGLGLQGLQAGTQAQLAGIQGAQTGLQGVGQQISGGQLGLQGVDAGIRGQQVGIQGTQAGTQAGQFGLEGARVGISGAQAATDSMRAGIQGQQTGIAGTQAGISAAGQLGQLGGQQFSQQMGITEAMGQAGSAQRGLQQQALDVDYQNYLDQQQYPFQQLAFMQSMYNPNATPLQQMESAYSRPPSALGQVTGAGLQGLGMYNMYRG